MNNLAVFISFLFVLLSSTSIESKPRVFIFTDINIDAGDPDDRQSLIHLLWYANELEIEGIVPGRWQAKGQEACQLAVEAYAKDYNYTLKKKGYPKPGGGSKSIGPMKACFPATTRVKCFINYRSTAHWANT